MRILFIGDIFSKPGRNAVIDLVKVIKEEEEIDLCIANVENATHGRSISSKHFDLLMNSGVDFMTMGNHTWEHEDNFVILSNKKNIVRPLNIKVDSYENSYGKGSITFNYNGRKIRLTNVLGFSCNAKSLQTNPFFALEHLVSSDDSDIHLIDFHADSTSEKRACFFQFAGRVSAILGTHTHVTTADEQICDGTAFITDVGMTGPKNSVIGVKKDIIINMYNEVTKGFKLEPANGVYQFNSVIIEIDDITNKAVSITRLNINNN